MVDIEALDGGVGLTGADGFHGGRVVADAVDAHFVTFDVAVEEAHVHGTFGLNLVTVGIEQRHVDGHGVLEHLALALNLFGHSINDVLTINLHSLDGGAFGEDAFGGRHFDGGAAHGGVAFERGAAHIGLNLDDLVICGRCLNGGLVGNIGGRLVALRGLGVFGCFDLGVARDGPRFHGGLIGGNGLCRRGHNQGAVHVLGCDGGDAVLGGDGHVRVRSVLRGDGFQLEAGVGAGRELQLFVQLGGEGFTGKHLVLHGHVGVLHLERHHGLVDGRGHERLRRRSRRSVRVGCVGCGGVGAVLHGFAHRLLIGGIDGLLGSGFVGGGLFALVAGECKDVRHRHDEHHRHEDSNELAFKRVFQIKHSLQHMITQTLASYA